MASCNKSRCGELMAVVYVDNAFLKDDDVFCGVNDDLGVAVVAEEEEVEQEGVSMEKSMGGTRW